MAKCEKVEDGGGEEDGANHWYHVVLKEGRNREVRRLFEALNLAVSRLIRTRYGTLAMPSVMKRGDTLELEAPEVNAVMEAAGLKGGAREKGPRPQGGQGQPRKHGQGGAPRPAQGPGPAQGEGARPGGGPRPHGKTGGGRFGKGGPRNGAGGGGNGRGGHAARALSRGRISKRRSRCPTRTRSACGRTARVRGVAAGRAGVARAAVRGNSGRAWTSTRSSPRATRTRRRS